jgi:hypothetical protein
LFQRSDGPGRWAVRFDGDAVLLGTPGGHYDIQISGIASDLALFLWQRTVTGASRLRRRQDFRLAMDSFSASESALRRAPTAGVEQRAATGAATRTPPADRSQPLRPSAPAQMTFSDHAATSYGSDDSRRRPLHRRGARKVTRGQVSR